jgi:archaellum component FlaC
MRKNFDQLLLENKELQKQIIDLQSLNTSNQNKVIESILAKHNSQLELTSNRILQKIELIKKLNQQKSSELEQISTQYEAVNKEVENFTDILNNVLSEISRNNSNNFIGENFVTFIKEFLTN